MTIIDQAPTIMRQAIANGWARMPAPGPSRAAIRKARAEVSRLKVLAKNRARRAANAASGLTTSGTVPILKKRPELAHLKGRDYKNAYKRLWYAENSRAA